MQQTSPLRILFFFTHAMRFRQNRRKVCLKPKVDIIKFIPHPLRRRPHPEEIDLLR